MEANSTQLESPDETQLWKRQYLESLEELDRKEKHWAALETQLYRSIQRLALAIYGTDESLDAELDAVRESARAKADAIELTARIDRVHEVRAAAETAASASANAALQRAAGRLLHGVEPRLGASRAAALRRRLEGAATEKDLEHIFEDLSRWFAEPEPEGASAPADADPRQILGDLLMRLDLPESQAPRVEAIRQRLREDLSSADLPPILSAIARLVAEMRTALHSQRIELEGFLQSVNRRLGDLDAFLAQTGQAGSERLDRGDALRAEVSTQVDGVREAVDRAADLGSLKSLVSERLDVISVQLERHLQTERDHTVAATETISGLKRRLGETQAEVRDLRVSLEVERVASHRDTLTGLPNRAAYEARIAEEHARWSRSGSPLSIVLWDIDHFKAVNDHYGHQAGDRMLRAIAELIRDQLRVSDFVARYGGEEIVVLMPDTERSAAHDACEQVRGVIERSRFRYREDSVTITASCGVTEFRDNDTVETAFARADQALYAAKDQGRNCCRIG